MTAEGEDVFGASGVHGVCAEMTDAIGIADELLDIFCGEGIIVDADVIKVGLEGGICRELATSEKVADGPKVGRSYLDRCVASHLLAIEVNGDGCFAEGYGDMTPAIGAESGTAESHRLLSASILYGETGPTACIHRHEDVVIHICAEVEKSLPGVASAPEDPRADCQFTRIGDGCRQLDEVVSTAEHKCTVKSACSELTCAVDGCVVTLSGDVEQVSMEGKVANEAFGTRRGCTDDGTGLRAILAVVHSLHAIIIDGAWLS